jgi:hypothetical protein
MITLSNILIFIFLEGMLLHMAWKIGRSEGYVDCMTDYDIKP